MYPATFREDMPCGRGFEWTLSGKVLSKKLMTNSKISLGSVEWIASLVNDRRFVNKSGQLCRILSGWNSEEVKIGKYSLDGYCKVDDVEYALEFDGCYFHGCKECKLDGVQKKDEREERKKFLEFCRIKTIRMKECHWNMIKRAIYFKSPISSLLYKNPVTETELLREIIKDEVYGFCVVDIIPNSEASKFIELNWLPIIRHDNIHFEDLPTFMQKDEIKKSFPRKTLVQTLHASAILLHTRLIQWYLANGFKITKIYKFYEFQKFPCYRNVHDCVYETRVTATIEKNEKKATAIKLVSNSMYGQMIMVRFIKYVFFRKTNLESSKVSINKIGTLEKRKKI